MKTDHFKWKNYNNKKKTTYEYRVKISNTFLIIIERKIHTCVLKPLQ